jgi:hypothetical protein
MSRHRVEVIARFSLVVDAKSRRSAGLLAEVIVERNFERDFQDAEDLVVTATAQSPHGPAKESA